MKKKPKSVRFYLLYVQGGTEPEVWGPYRNEEKRDEDARRTWAAGPAIGDGIFKLTTRNNRPFVTPYLEDELEEPECSY